MNTLTHYFSECVLLILIATLHPRQSYLLAAAHSAVQSAPAFPDLTKREREVLASIAQGLTNSATPSTAHAILLKRIKQNCFRKG